jgi:hypothetical protein
MKQKLQVAAVHATVFIFLRVILGMLGYWFVLLLFVPTVHFTLTQRGSHFEERPIAALKGERTVKGTVISRVNLSFVITRNGFCAETKPTIHFTEPVFIGKIPFPQEAERPFLTICLLRIARNDQCLFEIFTLQNEERSLTSEKGYSTLKRTTFVRE